MKKVLVALGVAVLLTVPAFAVTLDPGVSPFKAKLSDYSAVYRDGVPQPLGQPSDAPIVGDEQRSIFRVTNIFDNTDVNEVFGLSSSTELTGTLYDLQVLAVTVTASSIVLDFGRAGRNPLTADLIGADPTLSLVGAVSGFDYSGQVGGVLEVYEDAAKNFNPNPGGVATYTSKIAVGGTPPPIPFDPGAAPTFWVEGAAGHAPTTDGTIPVGVDDFVTVTDGNYWLAANLIPLQFLVEAGIVAAPVVAFTDGTLLRETIPINGEAGVTNAYANVAGGSAGGLFLEGLAGEYVDITMRINLRTAVYDALNDLIKRNPDYVGIGQWTVESEDPVRFATFAVPEPTTLSMLFIGLLGLTRGLRRTRK